MMFNNSRQRLSFLAVLVAALLLSVNQSAWAGGITHVVDDDGMATVSDCDAATPCFSTIGAALIAASSGDIIKVCPGTYTENVIVSKSVSIRGAMYGVDARNRVVGAPNPAVESIITAGAGTLLTLITGSAGTTIDGFVFVGGARGIESTSGPIDSIAIRNNHFAGFTGNAIFLNDSGSDITVHQNHANGSAKTAVGGTIHLDTDAFDGFHLTSNIVENGSGTAFFVDGIRNVGTSGARSSFISGNVFRNMSTNAAVNIGSRAIENATISLNTFDNNRFDGLQGGPLNCLITRNTFSNNQRWGLALTSFGNTSAGRGAINNDITENFFINNGTGPDLLKGDVLYSPAQPVGNHATNRLNRNSLTSAVGMVHDIPTGGAVVIDCGSNWWGAATGPTVANHPSGTGSAINGTSSANTDFTPWLNSGTDIDADPTNGFQGDFSTLNVDDDSPQFGTTGRIQEGINLVTASTVNVLPGSYAENILIDMSLELLGPHANTCPGTSLDRGGEAVLRPGSNSGGTLDAPMIYVTASNVAIKGLTLDGDNPAIVSGQTVGAADVDVDNLISNGAFDDDTTYPFVHVKNITIENNILKTANDVAVNLYNSGSDPVSDGNSITCNRVDNVQGLNTLSAGGPYDRIAVLLYNDTYANVNDNVMTSMNIAVQTGNNHRPNAGPAATISDNAISTENVGIWHNLHYQGASRWDIDDNIITSLVPDYPWGIYITSILDMVQAGASNNTVSGCDTGILFWNDPTSNTVTVTGGDISDCTYGITVINFSSFGDADATTIDVTGTTITDCNVGIFVADDFSTNLVRVNASQIDVSGCDSGLATVRPMSRLYLSDSLSSITGNLYGVRISGGRGRIETSNLTGNFSGGIYVDDNAICDAGDCPSFSNVTGMGSSIGGNNLTGYGFDNLAPHAIENANASGQPDVLAYNNAFGAGGGDDIEDVIIDDTDNAALSRVLFSQGADCTINATTPVCENWAGYTASVFNPGGGATFTWSVSAGGQIIGPTDGSSIFYGSVGAGGFTLTVTITSGGCTSTCLFDVTVNTDPISGQLSLSPVASCYEPGNTVDVRLGMANLTCPAAGFQAFVSYNSAHLTYTGCTYDLTAFGTEVITSDATVGSLNHPALGQIDVASGIDVGGGQVPTAADNLLVTLHFTALTNTCSTPVAFRSHTPPSRLADLDAVIFIEPPALTLANTALRIDGMVPTFTYCPPAITLECPESTEPGSLLGSLTGGIMIYYNDNGGGETPANQAYLKTQFSDANTNGAQFTFDNSPLTGIPGVTWATIFGQVAPPTQFGFDMVLPSPTNDGSVPSPILLAYNNVDNSAANRAADGSRVWLIGDYKDGSPNGPSNPTNVDTNSLIRGPTPGNPITDVIITRNDLSVVGPIYTVDIAGKLVSNNIIHWFDPVTPHSPMSAFGMDGEFYFSGTLSYDSTGDTGADLRDFYAGTITISANSPNTSVGVARAVDNCTLYPTISYSDLVTPGACDNTYTITRTWSATDECGRVATCDQTISVQDTTDPVFTSPCPGNITVVPTGGACNVVVNYATPTAEDVCGTSTVAVPVSCSMPSGSTFLPGTTTVTCTATDACGNSAECMFDVTVDAVPITATVELSPNIAPTGTLVRCITFDVWDCAGMLQQTVPVDVSFTVSSGPPMMPNVAIGVASFCAPYINAYSCITARDRLHTLRRTAALVPDGMGGYTANFTGDVTMGGDWLVGGNLNDDQFIDILDFGIWAGRYLLTYDSNTNGAPDGNTPCSPPQTRHADISGNGEVFIEDFTFIAIHFLESREANCCGDPNLGEPLAEPRREVKVSELAGLGIPEAAVADLNGDGLLDESDMILAALGGLDVPRDGDLPDDSTPIAAPAADVDD